MANKTKDRRAQAKYDRWLIATRRAVVAAVVEQSLETNPVTLDVTGRALAWAITSQGFKDLTVEERTAREDQLGAVGMWWLREIAGAIQMDDIARAGKWVVEQAGDDVGIATTMLTKAVWENDQATQIRVLTDAGDDRRRLLPVLALTGIVATTGQGDPEWLYAATGTQIPDWRPPPRPGQQS